MSEIQKRKRGRPVKEIKLDVHKNIRLAENDVLMLNELAENLGISQSEVIRRAIYASYITFVE